MMPRALASAIQSFNFLVDVADFKHVVHAAFTPNNKDTATGEDFQKLMAIMKAYIESNARSEVRVANTHQEPSKIEWWRPGASCAELLRRLTVKYLTYCSIGFLL